MIYFKHSQLTNDYHVSLKTVHNWIDAAKNGKLDLQLHEQNGRVYVANTPNNLIVLEKLADKGKKYRNNLHHKVVSPKPEFYETYSRRQVLDIISNLSIHHEIPQQYNYFDGGAADWDNWLERLREDKASNILKGTIDLIHSNLVAIDDVLEGYERVNIVDLGPGNALPVRELLEHLKERSVLHRYIAIDISKEMLSIAEKNVKKWFDGEVSFEGHQRDFSSERFDDLLVDDMLSHESDKTLNLVLLLGGTLENFRSPRDVIKMVYGSMGSQDLLIYTEKPDTEAARRYFDFNSSSGSSSLSPFYSLALSHLSVDGSFYDVERGFDEQNQLRFVRIRFKKAVTIRLTFEEGGRDISFEKGDTILLLRMWHKKVFEIISMFQNVGLTLLHANISKNREYLLTISGVAPDTLK